MIPHCIDRQPRTGAKEFSLVSTVLTQRTAVAANAELRRKGGF